MKFGILPHELMNCEPLEFLFDLSILTVKTEMSPEEEKVRKEWIKEMFYGDDK